MFTAQFIEDLEEINTSRTKREIIGNFLILKNGAVEEMLQLAGEKPQLFAKAMRAVEIVGREASEMLFPHLDSIIELAKDAKTDAEIRPIAKIFESLAAHFFKFEKTGISPVQQENVVQLSFDWLIDNKKAAVKAYSMHTLFMLGEKVEWVRGELKSLLEQNIAIESPAYKARARMLLKKMR